MKNGKRLTTRYREFYIALNNVAYVGLQIGITHPFEDSYVSSSLQSIYNLSKVSLFHLSVDRAP